MPKGTGLRVHGCRLRGLLWVLESVDGYWDPEGLVKGDLNIERPIGLFERFLGSD